MHTYTYIHKHARERVHTQQQQHSLNNHINNTPVIGYPSVIYTLIAIIGNKQTVWSVSGGETVVRLPETLRSPRRR